MDKLVFQKLLGLAAVIVGACLLSAEYGARIGWGVGLLVLALIPVERD